MFDSTLNPSVGVYNYVNSMSCVLTDQGYQVICLAGTDDGMGMSGATFWSVQCYIYNSSDNYTTTPPPYVTTLTDLRYYPFYTERELGLEIHFSFFFVFLLCVCVFRF